MKRTMKGKFLFALFFLAISSLSLCKVCLAEKGLLGYITDRSGEIQVRAAKVSISPVPAAAQENSRVVFST